MDFIYPQFFQGITDAVTDPNVVPAGRTLAVIGAALALEDYALEHARGDAMRLSVFTGPFLADDDPVLLVRREPRHAPPHRRELVRRRVQHQAGQRSLEHLLAKDPQALV